jgi:endogenous inhibitor of DNA gyrase (YacG/DUF329 family)
MSSSQRRAQYEAKSENHYSAQEAARKRPATLPAHCSRAAKYVRLASWARPAPALLSSPSRRRTGRVTKLASKISVQPCSCLLRCTVLTPTPPIPFSETTQKKVGRRNSTGPAIVFIGADGYWLSEHLMKKTCAHCGTTKWGLIRWRWYRRQFCSKNCRERFLDALAHDKERIRKWVGYLKAA